MSTLIGTFHESRMACADDLHLPTAFNPRLDETACQCGAVRWRGEVGTWHERYLYSGFGRGAELVGYDRYFLHRLDCPESGDIEGHICTEQEGLF